MKKLFLLFCLFGISSCAFFNDRNVDIAINSNPSGADIFIDGKNYGKTPTVVNIEPKPQIVTLSKEGYGTGQLKLETWGAVRTDVMGNRTSDGTRCWLDMMSVVFFFNAFTTKCADFTQKEYSLIIPNNGNALGAPNKDPLMGAANSPNNMIDYYYHQDMSKNNKSYEQYYQQDLQSQYGSSYQKSSAPR